MALGWIGNQRTFLRVEQEQEKQKQQKLFDATVTPSLLHASGTWTMVEEMKKKLQTAQQRMMEMTVQCPAAAHAASVDPTTVARAASVDVTADVEPHDPDSEPENDTTGSTMPALLWVFSGFIQCFTRSATPDLLKTPFTNEWTLPSSRNVVARDHQSPWCDTKKGAKSLRSTGKQGQHR